ncbi:MAG: amino acid permease [Ruthenibacterium sp.]
MSMVALIGVTIAFFASVRPVPQVAETGWTLIFYMLFAALLFAVPLAMMSAELSTAYPQKGGSQVWVSNGLSPTWAFVSSWLLMLVMLSGMVMILSTVGELLGYVIGKPNLGENNVLSFVLVVGVFWLLTILALKIDILRFVNLGAILGIYIPFTVLAVLGCLYLARNGIMVQSYLANFKPSMLLPDLSHPRTLPMLAAFIFIFAGVEMSSVHINEVNNPKKTYPLGVLIAIGGVTIFSIIAGLGAADVNVPGQMLVANVSQTFHLLFAEFGIPPIFERIIALCILIGIIAQVSTWIMGPCHAMHQVAKQGGLPPFFQKTDAHGNPCNIMITQAILASCIALLLVVVPNVDEVFNILTISANLFYCVIYILIAISAIRLRYKKPTMERPFRLGKRGNAAMWACASVVLFCVLLTIYVSLIPPADVANKVIYTCGQAGFVLLMVGAALLVDRFKKPSWKQASAPESTQSETKS